MHKQEFLARLRDGLSGMPQGDIEERIIFYSEMIDDRMEEGLSEDEAVEAIGTVPDVVAQILTDMSPARQAKEKAKEKNRARRSVRPWEIVLLVLGCPVWLPLLIAALVVVLAVYIVVWSAVLSLWAVEVSFWAGTLSGMLLTFTVSSNGAGRIAMLAIGLCCAGLSIFLFFGCKAVTKGTLLLTKKAALGLRSRFVGKEAA